MTGIEDRAFENLTVRQLHDILRLRVDVFVVEQHCPYPDLDGNDGEPETRHIWAVGRGGEVAAYLRLLVENDTRRIGRVVTAPKYRRSGLARRLLEHVMDRYIGDLVLDAQSHLVDWYESHGFATTGPEFLDDGIPHVPMKRIDPQG